jgi:hypothetical protein
VVQHALQALVVARAEREVGHLGGG